MNKLRNRFNLNEFHRKVFEKDHVMSNEPFDEKKTIFGKLSGLQKKLLRDVRSLFLRLIAKLPNANRKEEDIQ